MQQSLVNAWRIISWYNPKWCHCKIKFYIINFTLHMLNCFKDSKIYTHISYHVLDCVWQRKTKFRTKQVIISYTLPILFCQYHAWWCSSSRQGISRLIWSISRNIPSLAAEELIHKWHPKPRIANKMTFSEKQTMMKWTHWPCHF